MNKKVYCKRTKAFYRIFAAAACSLLLAGCQAQKPDDYATNQGYSDNSTVSVQNTTGITKENIKVGVIHLSDPAEGSGYTYTHDLGIQGMQQNLGLSDDQIIRKINVDDSDAQKTRTAIQECIDAGCNIIFSTSWGYMQTTAEMAEQYSSVYFSHGTGYLSNGKNFNNYFGKIYQPRYLSGIVAGMNTKTNKIGYVAAMDSSNSEVTGGIDAFALGVYSVNPDAQIYVKVTNSWYSPEAEKAAAATLLDMNCDVITQHCDTLYPQTLAQERGVYSIGYNSDMSKNAPDACLCSVIWNWSAYYTSAVQSVLDGTWDGSNYYGGMNENLVSIT
ncbi:MAG: BMP family ABC transporter substrate-binding protein, partial [Lachnospira sp.]|nr:BMP family ABC transporter substrate-binding protein [Lachnospira sp.]